MLLSITDSSQKSTRLRFRSAADCACVADAVTAAFDQWAPQWDIGRPDEAGRSASLSASGDLSDLVDAKESDWHVLDGRAATGVWWTFSTEARGLDTVAFAHRVLLRRLFNDVPDIAPHRSRGRMADELAATAWDEWLTALRNQLCEPVGDTGQVAYASPRATTEGFGGAVRAWSGAVLVAMQWCGLEMRLLLSGDSVESLIKRRSGRQKPAPAVPVTGPRVTPVLDAVTDKAVTLRVELNPFEIDLGSLGRLKAGDVLLTRHCLDDLLSVRLAASEDDAASSVVCRGFLGRLGERVAVELLPDTTQAS